MTEISGTSRRQVGSTEARTANRRWWDASANEYQAEHGGFLGDVRFVWCPEGLDEADIGLLGEVRNRRVLEVGCGAAQCTRWLVTQGATAYGIDLSASQLQHAMALNRSTAVTAPVIQADANLLPFDNETFDVAFAAYGAVQFVADSAALTMEVARVLRPGGLWVFSLTHPIRWCFPDDPGRPGLVAQDSYWDRRPYVEEGADGEAIYVEQHRTLGDRVREIVDAGLTLRDLIEPQWPLNHERPWGGWSPLRGRVIPGTAIFACRKSA